MKKRVCESTPVIFSHESNIVRIWHLISKFCKRDYEEEVTICLKVAGTFTRAA